MKNISWLKGLMFGVLFSFITTFLFILLGYAVASGIHFVLINNWLYFLVIIPVTFTVAILRGYFRNRNEFSNKVRWLLSFICTSLIILFAGTLFSIITVFLFAQIGIVWAGGRITLFFGSESWLYYSVIIPFTITFAILGGYFHNRNELSNKKLWAISLICAFLVTLYSGTIGAIFGETIVRGGMETINVEGTLVWGALYAFILLPFTTPFARFLIGIFYKIIENKKPNYLKL
ncbi:hypothetical protein [Cytobacillus sp. IB215665]|uniref:hypothetical protein n=1 Tax=Cytobacillus sp. IB215665 TaxID=3097357 RepID=UPI002A0B2807|nr:hypothetical protein [Cytobacillus sp. IB215665]MDX8367944.1 hypothetical protein [Cytobacillus sp. IB215665]